jgi:2'-5' RNA ligase
MENKSSITLDEEIDDIMNKLHNLKFYEKSSVVQEGEEEKQEIPLCLVSKRPKKRGPYYHMVCLYIDDKHIQNKVKDLHKFCLKSSPELREYPDALKRLGRLHFTMLFLPTSTEEKLEKAKAVLDGCKKDIRKLMKRKLSLKLDGLYSFKNPKIDDEKNTNVLYTKFTFKKGLYIFHSIVHILTVNFIKSGLLTKEEVLGYGVFYDESKKRFGKKSPHLTLVNTNSVRTDGVKIPFDGDTILEKYSKSNFGSFSLDKISICECDDTDDPLYSVHDMHIFKDD